MIYLENKTTAQRVLAPKNGAIPDGKLVFQAKSTIDLDMMIAQEVTDLDTSSQYFDFSVTLPEGLPNGEYEYYLGVGAYLQSTGLLVIGEGSEPSEYNKEITYEQYETE